MSTMIADAPQRRKRTWTIATNSALSDQVHRLWDLDSPSERMLGRILWSVRRLRGQYVVTLDVRDMRHRKTLRQEVLRFDTRTEVVEELAHCKAQLAAAVAA